MKTTLDSRIKKAVAVIDGRLQVLRTALFNALKEGVQSASISNGGASQSFTVLSVQEMRIAIADLENQKQLLLSHGKRQTLAPNFTFTH